MTYPRDNKQYKRKRRYPRIRRDALLDGHEAVNNRLRRQTAGLKDTICTRDKQIADYQAQLGMALRRLCDGGKRHHELNRRLESALDANQTLRVENAGLRMANDTLRKADGL